MNRAFVLGIAIFFAVCGIVLLGGESSKAVAGHGCHCSCSCSDACSGGCSACHRCHDRCNGCSCGGLFARLRSRCCKPACCAPACSCPAPCGGAAEPAKDAPAKPAAPPAPKTSSINRGFRTVSFVR